MKFLFVASEISPPYTEGRKRFVLDLAHEIQRKDAVHLLTTASTTDGEIIDSIPRTHHHCGSRLRHLLWPTQALQAMITRFRPDVICHFPYGTFRHVYGYASQWSMARIDRISRKHGIPCITLMYSIDDATTPEKLKRKVSCLAIQPRPGWQGATVALGRDYHMWPRRREQGAGRTLLFMAGMWQSNTQRVDHVLETRGLSVLLQAGRLLGPHGVNLIVASPLFRDEACRRYLLQHPTNAWPSSQLSLKSIVDVPAIYHDADLFVFPYQRDIAQFVPTSVIEAMVAGTPVIMTDLPCLRRLANGGETAYLFPPHDAPALAATVLAALSDQTRRGALAERAQHYAVGQWSIERSAHDLRELATQLNSLSMTRCTPRAS